ncbi:TetR/AcrR family transcriptional regulator [Castellaniella caeni]|uniref:TetR/AcrR family transcriptional regulator n=1 Tax=Castellaniella caeni TaxID=266123 RepID=UPI0018DE4D1F|nr:TetR/AcrR family transcriptional regulator [Castellaniella caeni]
MPKKSSELQPASSAGPSPAKAARQPRNRRLPAQERRDQILDAALHEFSRSGFGAARMDDIAERAGLSKGGLYAHFGSKETLFQALMQRMLLPDLLFEERPLHPPMAQGQPRARVDLAARVDDFLERAYGRLEDERFIRTLHLLLAEGPRAPGALDEWRASHLQLLRTQQLFVSEAVESGLLRDSALTDMVQLVHAPILLAALLKMLQADAHARATIPRLRAAHRRLLLTLLPPEPAGADAAPAAPATH